MRVILHIGMSKTGTSSIQATCSKNRGRLKAEGVLYPNINNMNRHSFLSVPFREGNVPREFWTNYGADKNDADRRALEFWQQVRDDVKSEKPDTLILSGEQFFPVVHFDALKAQLAEVAPGSEVNVLCYLRHPCQHYLSAFQQIIKASSRIPRPGKTKWADNLTRWKAIGPLFLREFNRKKFRGGDVVLDFLDFSTGKALEGIEVDYANETMSAEAMAIIQPFRKYLESNVDNVFNQQSIQLLNWMEKLGQDLPADLSPTKPALNEVVKYHVMDKSFRDVKRLKREFGFSFSDKSLYDRQEINRRLDELTWDGDPRYEEIDDVIILDRKRVQALYSKLLEKFLNM